MALTASQCASIIVGGSTKAGKYPYSEYPSIQQASEKWAKWEK